MGNVTFKFRISIAFLSLLTFVSCAQKSNISGALMGSTNGASSTVIPTQPSGPTPNPTPGPTPGIGAPAAPTNLLLNGQGLNSSMISWTAAAPGQNPISYYKIYRNGVAYDQTKSTSYTDTTAPNTTAHEDNGNNPLNCATTYIYTVSAVDSLGVEGPQATNMTSWMYYNGTSNWGEGGWNYGTGFSVGFQDTAGIPESGSFDIVLAGSAGSGWQPYPGDLPSAPAKYTKYDFEAGQFNYFTVDIKPTSNAQTFRLSMMSRLPPGDVFPWAGQNFVSPYGSLVANKWTTFKFPLADMTIGVTKFIGSISGNTLTVTSVISGVGVDNGGWITGAGIPANTYISGNGNGIKGGPGTYTICGPGSTSNSGTGCLPLSSPVVSTTITEQRTGLYKFDIINESGGTYYIDNVGFTVK